MPRTYEQLLTVAGSGISRFLGRVRATLGGAITCGCEKRHLEPIITAYARLNNHQVLMGIGVTTNHEKKYTNGALPQAISLGFQGDQSAVAAYFEQEVVPRGTQNSRLRVLPHQGHARDGAGEAEADVVDRVAAGGVRASVRRGRSSGRRAALRDCAGSAAPRRRRSGRRWSASRGGRRPIPTSPLPLRTNDRGRSSAYTTTGRPPSVRRATGFAAGTGPTAPTAAGTARHHPADVVPPAERRRGRASDQSASIRPVSWPAAIAQ